MCAGLDKTEVGRRSPPLCWKTYANGAPNPLGLNGRAGKPARPSKSPWTLLWANSPDHPVPGICTSGPIGRSDELAVCAGLAEIAHCTIVHDPCTAVRAHPHIGRPVEAVNILG